MNNADFVNDIPAALIAFPKLHAEDRGGVTIVKGDIDLMSDGNLEDTYSVEIHQTIQFPFLFPKVYEVGGRIPINADWHVYEDTGVLCIAPPPEEILACRKGLSLSHFIQDWLKPYLFSQTFRRKNGYFYRERSHGVKGVMEYYQEKLNEPDAFKVIILMQRIAKLKEPGRTENCFCGSGVRYRKCHRDAYRRFSEMSSQQFLGDIERFKSVPMETLKEWNKKNNKITKT